MCATDECLRASVRTGVTLWFPLLLLSTPAQGPGTDPPLRGLPEGEPHGERLLRPGVPEHADELGE